MKESLCYLLNGLGLLLLFLGAVLDVELLRYLGIVLAVVSMVVIARQCYHAYRDGRPGWGKGAVGLLLDLLFVLSFTVFWHCC